MLDEKTKKEIDERIHRSACFQRVFQGTEGKFVLDEIDKFTNYKNSTFDPDPYKSAYSAGQRSMAVFIHNVIEQDIEEVKKRLAKEI